MINILHEEFLFTSWVKNTSNRSNGEKSGAHFLVCKLNYRKRCDQNRTHVYTVHCLHFFYFGLFLIHLPSISSDNCGYIYFVCMRLKCTYMGLSEILNILCLLFQNRFFTACIFYISAVGEMKKGHRHMDKKNTEFILTDYSASYFH
jgi:hypothetical protein